MSAGDSLSALTACISGNIPTRYARPTHRPISPPEARSSTKTTFPGSAREQYSRPTRLSSRRCSKAENRQPETAVRYSRTGPTAASPSTTSRKNRLYRFRWARAGAIRSCSSPTRVSSASLSTKPLKGKTVSASIRLRTASTGSSSRARLISTNALICSRFP